jgi:two-component system chemotaxis sensor kinase CheA
MQTVVKPLGREFRGVPGIAGSTVLGDGRVGLIIDVPSLLRGVMQSTLQAQA